MADWMQYLGNLHDILAPHWAGIVLVSVSVVCGLAVGAEREARQKAAGIRTVSLICVGSTIFTLASVMLATDNDDRTRIAAQVVTGVGFLGAGAIIRNRGNVIGLTTGATVWTVAAIGVLVGGGFAAAGVVLTMVVVFMLAVVGRIEMGVLEPCRFVEIELIYLVENGKTRVRLLRILDDYRIPDKNWSVTTEGDKETVSLRYCHYHRPHRSLLFDVADLPGLLEIRRERAPREDKK